MQQYPNSLKIRSLFLAALLILCCALTVIPMPVIPRLENRPVQVSVKGGMVKFSRLDLHVLGSAWPR